MDSFKLIAGGPHRTLARKVWAKMQLFRQGKKHPTITTLDRLKFPKQAEAADYNHSRASAIYMFCRQCVGSGRAATKCESYECPLWPFRSMGAVRNPTPRPPGYVPMPADYAGLIEAKGDAPDDDSNDDSLDGEDA